MTLPFRTPLTAFTFAALLAACGGGGGSNASPPVTAPPPPPAAQTISLGASGSTMLGSAPVTISAILGQSADVSWTLGNGNPGTLSSTSGSGVTYTPPATRVSNITPVSITATSSGVSKTLRLALYPDPGTPGLSLVAGSLGGHAIIDGSGSEARFNNIVSMAADSDGSVIVADQPGAIRRVSAAGVVGTLLSTEAGHADGSAAQARLGQLMTLTVAPDHSIYLIDYYDNKAYLRRLGSEGTLSTIATLTPGTAFSSNAKVVVDGSGRVTVLSTYAIYTVSNGTLTLLAGAEQGGGGSVDGSGAAASFIYISDTVADSAGNLYLIDNFSVRKVTPSGQVSTLAGVAADSTSPAIDGSGSAARFGRPGALALNASGNLLVLDRDPNGGGRSGYQIRQVTPAGAVTTPYSGADPKAYPVLNPVATATPNTRLRISSGGAVILASTGQLQTQQTATSAMLLAGLEGDSGDPVDGQGAAARFVNPATMAADLNGNLYLLDNPRLYGGGNQLETPGIALRKISASGLVSTISGLDSPLVPTAMFTDGEGNLYISARWPLGTLTGIAPGGVIYKVTPQGSFSVLAGSTAPTTAPADGSGSAAAFTYPTLQGIDADGNLYATDVNLRPTSVTSYRKVTPQGVVTTISAIPAGLNKAPDGAVYSADRDASVIYRVAADGSKTVVAGVANVRGTRLGALPGGLDAPTSVVPTGPGSFALISGAAVLRLVVPH
jgi:hypothetical protein